MAKTVDAVLAEQGLEPGRQGIARNGFMDDVRSLSRIDNPRAALIILRQWLVIALTFLVIARWPHWTLFPLAMVVIASRQHALGVIMHDATHYRLFSRNWANDFFSDILCAFPVGLSTSGYRYQHLLHHRHVNTEGDPYWRNFQEDPAMWAWPKTPSAALKILLGDLFLINLRPNMKGVSPWTPWPYLFGRGGKPGFSRAEHLRFFAFLAAAAALIHFTGLWLEFLLLWVLPGATILTVFGRIRAVAEHLGLPEEDEFSDTRHVDGSLLERLTICPLNINIHIAHHMFPSVPLYRLKELQTILMGEEVYRRNARNYPSYFGWERGAVRELLRSSRPVTRGVEVS